ncbi:MAG: hypothetical protein ACXU9J_05310, partial [Syntrophales bacterium]
MLERDRGGHVKLPPPICAINNPLVSRKKPIRIEIDQTPVSATKSDIQPTDIIRGAVQQFDRRVPLSGL